MCRQIFIIESEISVNVPFSALRLKQERVALHEREESTLDKFHFMEQHLKEIDEIVESSKYFR